MQYKGVRYELSTGIVLHEWKVAIYIEESKPGGPAGKRKGSNAKPSNTDRLLHKNHAA
jgi:hypothetical protein